MKLTLALLTVLLLAGCTASIPLQDHNVQIGLANTQIVAANSTAGALRETATALVPQLETAQAGFQAASTSASSAKSEAASQARRVRDLISTITVLAPTPTPPCPEGLVSAGDGTCVIPTPTLPPTPTLSPAQRPKRSGIYLIGPEIAPGYWRGTSRGDGCYWEIDSASGDIVNNHFGSCTSIMQVPDWATSVEIRDGVYEYCGASPATCPVVP